MISIITNHQALRFHSDKVNEVFNDIISKEYIIRNKIKVFLPKCFIRFLSTYQEILVSGKPNELLRVHQNFERLGITNDDMKNVKSFFIQTGYENFQKNHSKEFLNYLGIDTCVYCNRNYTLNLVKTHSRAELDHWFPKDKFPELALSFYNLIPSCHSCNHIKGSSNKIEWWRDEALKDIIHPYFKENNENFKFSFFYNDSLDNFKIELKKTKYSKIEKTLKFNKTKEIYNSHSEKELKDLLDLRYKYSDNYIDILINKTFKGLMGKEEIYRMVFGIETKEEDYHKRPFSKFKHDIIEELKHIIK